MLAIAIVKLLIIVLLVLLGALVILLALLLGERLGRLVLLLVRRADGAEHPAGILSCLSATTLLLLLHLVSTN